MNIDEIWGRFKDDWDVIILLCIAIPIAILDMLPEGLPFSINLSLEGYMKLILIALLAIASSIMRSNTKALHDGADSLRQKVNDLLLLSRGKISAIRIDEHPEIWEGFVGNYFAINAPWAIEDRSNLSMNRMVEKHAARYKDEKFTRATYVFFTKGNERCYFPKAIERFSDFARRIIISAPEAAEKIRVIVVDDELAPGMTVFSGEKIEPDGQQENRFKYSVIYVNDSALMSKSGVPKWALVSVDEAFNGSLDGFVKDVIDNHESVNLKTFLKERLVVNNMPTELQESSV
jgi:hypothetical protein